MLDLRTSNAKVTPPRQPAQERSVARMTKVLETAEQLLEQLGPEKTSIPAIAEASGVPRAAIYPFFPDKYALFSHLARLHMERLVVVLSEARLDNAADDDWRAWVQVLIETATDYYNRHPVASILLLRGALADGDDQAHAVKNQAISTLLRTKMSALTALPESPDAAVLSVEIAFACMKYGYAQEGSISATLCREAVHAAQAYLAQWARR